MLKVGATLCQVELEGSSEPTSNSPENTTSTPLATQSQSESMPQGTTTKQFKLADIGEGITECEVVKW